MALEVTESFQASLDELKFNSKPQISMLTMLAEDHEQYAKDIVRVIEEQIKKVSVSRKLPILYLIDSIVKNLPKTLYPLHFEQCIVQIFCGVFEEVDEKTRQSMYKLRQTWMDIIPNKRLYAMDVGVRHFDPAWPVTASPPEQGNIHVNPKFLKGKDPVSQFQKPKKTPEDVNDKMHAKERELKKVKQELEDSKRRLEQQQLQMRQAKSGKKIIDREPPSIIALPPAVTTSTHTPLTASVKSNDPRLIRDPRLNRDPRLRKQLESQSKETDTTLVLTSKSSAHDIVTEKESKAGQDSKVHSTLTPRLDLVSLINSFTNVATKVAAVQAQKNVPQAVGKEISPPPASHEPSLQTESAKRLNISSIDKPLDDEFMSKPSKTQASLKHSSHSQNIYENPPRKKAKTFVDQEQKSNTSDSTKTTSRHSNSDSKDKPLKKSPKSDKLSRDGKDEKVTHKDGKGRETRNDQKGKSPVKGSKGKESEKDSASPKKDRHYKIPNRSKNDQRGDRNKESNNDKKGLLSHSSSDKRDNANGRNLDQKHIEHANNSKDSQSKRLDGGLHKEVDTADSKVLQRDRSPLKKEKEEKKHDTPKMKVASEKGIEQGTDALERTETPIESLKTEQDSPVIAFVSQDSGVKKEIAAEIEDVDMRIGSQMQDKSHSEKPAIDILPENNREAEIVASKRPKSESDIPNLEDAPSEKRPRLEEDSSQSQQKLKKSSEDISQLFGAEDVDYRNLTKRPSVMIPPPAIPDSLLSPTVKGPAERRWSQFKESHPDEFAHEMERKRLRTAQIQEIQDVDMRQLLVSPRQASLPLPPLMDLPLEAPRPKERSEENRDLILQRAERELKEGRMSPSKHKELVRQVEEVYDMPRGRIDSQRLSKNLDLRDPRLRGSHDQPSCMEDSHERNLSRPSDGKANLLSDPSSEVRNGPHPLDRKIPLLPKPLRHDANVGDIESRSPLYNERDEDLRRGYRQESSRPTRGRYEYDRRRNIPHDYDERRSQWDYDYGDERSLRDFDDRRQNRFREFERRPRRQYGGEDKMPGYEEDNHHYGRGRFHRPTGRHEMEDVRHGPRRKSPPQDRKQPQEIEMNRDLSPDAPTRSSHGSFEGTVSDGPPKRHESHPLGRKHSPDHPRFAKNSEDPSRPLPGPNVPPRGPLPPPVRPGSGAPEKIVLSDPLDDPRWAPMKGLLDSEGTEEVVIDDKPFELRMGTSRKLRMYGQLFDVAVDVKERGIRVDGQFVYKLGEPIKEVPIRDRMVRLYYHGLQKPIWLDGQQHEMRIDAPPRNVMIDGVQRGFQIDGRDMMVLVDRIEKGPYGGPPRKIRIVEKDHEIGFQFPSRQILIDGKPSELKLDSKIPFVIIEGKPHGIRFDGEPKTIYVNDQPYTIPLDRAERVRIGPRPTYISFGGPAHEIIIDGKWFEVKFDNVPKDIHLGSRHFSIRIPGPHPRVKILDQFPANFDVSRLMMTHKMPPRPLPASLGTINPNAPDQTSKGGPNQAAIGTDKQDKPDEISPREQSTDPPSQTQLGPPGANGSMPGMNAPAPGMNTPRPGIHVLRPGINVPRPGLNIPRQGISAPVPIISAPAAATASGINIPRPTIERGINVPRAEINAPVPGINTPAPASGINVPRPGINIPRPGLNMPTQMMSAPRAVTNVSGTNSGHGPGNVPAPQRQSGPAQRNRIPGVGMMPQRAMGMMNQGNQGMIQTSGMMQSQGLGVLSQGPGMMAQRLMNPGMMQAGAGIMSQPGANFMQNLLRPQFAGNPILQQIGLRGSMPNMMTMQGNPGLLTQPQPVNLIAQGLLSQVANSMQFAAGIQALNQINQNQKNHPTPGLPASSDDHAALMGTGFQGMPLLAQNNPGIASTNSPSFPTSLPGLAANSATVSQVLHPATVPVKNEQNIPAHLQETSGNIPVSSSLLASLPMLTGNIGPTSSVAAINTPSQSTVSNQLPGSFNDSSSDGKEKSVETTAAKTPLDINNLLSSLLKVGLIKDVKSEEPGPATENDSSSKNDKKDTGKMDQESSSSSKEIKFRGPNLTGFRLEDLKKFNKQFVNDLHKGIQCHTCSARFTDDDQEKYRAHLDWHFRQNKLDQEMLKVAKNRKWYYTIPDWIQYEELEDVEEKSRSEIFEQMKAGSDPVAVKADQIRLHALEGKNVIRNPVASGIEGEDVCVTCGDPFDQMWNEETEEWILKNTIKVNGKTYHPVCYEDMNETPTVQTDDDKSNPLDVSVAEALQSSIKEEHNMDTSESTCDIPVQPLIPKVEVKTEVPEPSLDFNPEASSHQSQEGDASAASPSNDELSTYGAKDVLSVEIKSEPGLPPTVSQSEPGLPPTVSQSEPGLPPTVSQSEPGLPPTVSQSEPGLPPTVSQSEPGLPPTVSHAPNLLSTIATTIKREIIPILQEDPNSPWEMDSNPTPELSRTPTPEPVPSFTPVLSRSFDSVASSLTTEVMATEDPIPPTDSVASINDANNSPGIPFLKDESTPSQSKSDV